MGKKVDPRLFRLPFDKWKSSIWFDLKNYKQFVKEDYEIRSLLTKKIEEIDRAILSHITIERINKKTIVIIYTSKPSAIIGQDEKKIAEIRKYVTDRIVGDLEINIQSVRKPELDAKLIALGIAKDIESRLSYKRSVKRAIRNTMRSGAEGILVVVAGRLNGSSICRTEKFREGKLPLQTLDYQIGYAEEPAHTTYGICGIKVYIAKGFRRSM